MARLLKNRDIWATSTVLLSGDGRGKAMRSAESGVRSGQGPESRDGNGVENRKHGASAAPGTGTSRERGAGRKRPRGRRKKGWQRSRPDAGVGVISSALLSCVASIAQQKDAAGPGLKVWVPWSLRGVGTCSGTWLTSPQTPLCPLTAPQGPHPSPGGRRCPDRLFY